MIWRDGSFESNEYAEIPTRKKGHKKKEANKGAEEGFIHRWGKLVCNFS
jgi:hypothetical protein